MSKQFQLVSLEHFGLKFHEQTNWNVVFMTNQENLNLRCI